MAQPSPEEPHGNGYGEPIPASLRRVEQADRRVEALSLRVAGFTYEQIGERLGMSSEGAKHLVNRSLANAENKNAEALREVENHRLDRAQTAIWTQVLQGDLRAVDIFLRISARRAKMNGFDAPTSHVLSINVRQDMEAALKELEKVVLGQIIEGEVDDTQPG